MNDPHAPYIHRSQWSAFRLRGVPADADTMLPDEPWSGRAVSALPPARSDGNRYSLAVAAGAQRQLARGWLWLGLWSLS